MNSSDRNSEDIIIGNTQVAIEYLLTAMLFEISNSGDSPLWNKKQLPGRGGASEYIRDSILIVKPSGITIGTGTMIPKLEDI